MTEYYDHKRIQTCNMCDKHGIAEDDFIALVFNGLNICEGCKADLEKLIITEKTT